VSARRGYIARALLFLLRAYQAFLSPLMPSSCKFYPTCSQYAHEAVARFGARRGAWLTLKRLSRCRPFHAGGFDPVPDPETNVHDSADHVDEGGAHESKPTAHTEEFAR
jgi:putative membrane protein insertion efficiency factor